VNVVAIADIVAASELSAAKYFLLQALQQHLEIK